MISRLLKCCGVKRETKFWLLRGTAEIGIAHSYPYLKIANHFNFNEIFVLQVTQLIVRV